MHHYCSWLQDRGWFQEPLPSPNNTALTIRDNDDCHSVTSFETVSRHSVDATSENVVYSEIVQAIKSPEEEQEHEEEKEDMERSSRNNVRCEAHQN